MIIRVECNSVKEKDILFDLMHLGKLEALFTRATMKGYLDESENREVEFVELRFPDGVIDSQSEYSKFCKVMKFFLAYIQGNTAKVSATINDIAFGNIGDDNDK